MQHVLTTFPAVKLISGLELGYRLRNATTEVRITTAVDLMIGDMVLRKLDVFQAYQPSCKTAPIAPQSPETHSGGLQNFSHAESRAARPFLTGGNWR